VNAAAPPVLPAVARARGAALRFARELPQSRRLHGDGSCLFADQNAAWAAPLRSFSHLARAAPIQPAALKAAGCAKIFKDTITGDHRRGAQAPGRCLPRLVAPIDRRRQPVQRQEYPIPLSIATGRDEHQV